MDGVPAGTTSGELKLKVCNCIVYLHLMYIGRLTLLSLLFAGPGRLGITEATEKLTMTELSADDLSLWLTDVSLGWLN